MNFYNWLVECFKAIPSSYLTESMTIFIIMIISSAYKHLKNRWKKLRVFNDKISARLKILSLKNKHQESGYLLTIVPAPEYKSKRKVKSQSKLYKSNEDETWLYIIITFIITLILGVLLKNYYPILQTILSKVLLVISILVSMNLIKIVITRRTFKATLNFILYSIPVMIYLNYFIKKLPLIINQIPSINISSISEIAYILLGIAFLFLIIVLDIFILLRILILLINKYNEKLGRNFIATTKIFDNITFCIAMIILLTALSYGFTTGLLYNYIISLSI